jgi:hypothetical protein
VFSFAKKVSRPDLACVTPWKLLMSRELECGGGLLLLRHGTPRTRRDVIYFYSGAHTLRRLPFIWRLENWDLEKFAGLHTSGPHAYRHQS